MEIRMRSRRKHRYRTGLIAVVAVVVLAVLAAGTFLVKRYAPSKEWMDGYKYFEVDSNTDKTFVIIDNKSYSDIGVMRDDVLYLPVNEKCKNTSCYSCSIASPYLYCKCSNKC